MMSNTLREVTDFLGFGHELNRVNAHHNFAQLEEHDGKALWITRKGAIQADAGRLGIIPGLDGDHARTSSRGRATRPAGTRAPTGPAAASPAPRPASSSPWRTWPREMGDRTWLKHRAKSLIDEIPSAYKDIDQVMADQTDLVEVKHTLRQILNYKGV